MTWLGWLTIAVVVSAVAALTGVKPKGTRPIAHTHLMTVARIFLAVFLVIIAYLLVHR